MIGKLIVIAEDRNDRLLKRMSRALEEFNRGRCKHHNTIVPGNYE